MVSLVEYPALAIASAAALGLLVGSFLNVVILRLPLRMQWQWERDAREVLGFNPGAEPGRSGVHSRHDASDADADTAMSDSPSRHETTMPAPPPGIVVERSHCPKCGHAITALENIPLLSFIALGGKCRGCKAKISWQYPAVEALTGVLFALIVWRFGVTWEAGALLVVTGFLVAMSGIDARTTLLPDVLTLPLLWFGLLLSLVPLFVTPVDAILGAAVGYLSLWSVYWGFKLLTGKEGMGYGDFKLLAAIGAFCGWKAILPVVLMSSIIGAIVGVLLIAIQGRDRATPIPFGPYLAAAGWVQMFHGGDLLDAYLRFIAA
ncbi:A24 family peptidase [Xanthomonadaceae bacterium JHOS43]|nr:A24 family peptidase [Xanthomonadaceae bacterium JHOS43]